MITKSNTIAISSGYEDLFSFKNDGEKIEHDAQMISYRILSEVEKLCDDRNIRKKDLADLVGTSKSYITQLFNGTKSINTIIMAKLENALNTTFEIRLKLNEETYDDFLHKQIGLEVFTKRRMTNQNGAWYFCAHSKKSGNIVNSLETKNKQKQVG